jgi:hypothetical protein
VLPFFGRFVVAVAVAERAPGSAMPDWVRQFVSNQPSAREAATQSSPPVR